MQNISGNFVTYFTFNSEIPSIIPALQFIFLLMCGAYLQFAGSLEFFLRPILLLLVREFHPVIFLSPCLIRSVLILSSLDDLLFFNPYPANVDNMASSYQC